VRVDGVDRIWEDAAVEVHRLVVGPVENNVFVVRCRRTGDAVLIDAANEHERLLEVCTALQVRSVVETHGHWDHVQAVGAVREAGLEVMVRKEDAAMLDSYDLLIEDDDVLEVGRLRVRTAHTPGHTPGSICFHVEGTPLLFTGDTLFPGGPGNTKSDLGDFSLIIRSITDRIYAAYPDETIVLPGHGAATTIGTERPLLDEWVERGW
jgi:glyoxylase-like metal-dependent hydrolase (beta-lactamase superfamily II)